MGQDYIFTAQSHSGVYYTITATSAVYVTFDPNNLDEVLPVKETTVGLYEKFNFTFAQ